MNNKDFDDIDIFFNNIITKLNGYSGVIELDSGLEQGIRLSKTNKGARVNARIEALKKGEEFDETETPEVELKTKNDDIIDELVNREIKKILGI